MDIQLLVLLGSLAGLLLIASRLQHESWPKVPDAGPEIPILPGARFAPVVAGCLIGATVGLTQSDAPSFQAFDNRSATALKQIAMLYPEGSWRGGPTDRVHSLEIPYSENLDIVVIAAADGIIRASDQLMLPEDSVGWRHTDTNLYRDCAVQDCIDLVHKTWRQTGSLDTRHSLYAYYIGDMVTDSKLVFDLANGWNRLRGYPLATGLISFNLRGSLPGNLHLGKPFTEFKKRLSETSPAYSAAR